MDFAGSADQGVKMKEREKEDQFLNLTRELKKLWNMKVIVIPNIIGALVTMSKGLVRELEELEIRGRVEAVRLGQGLDRAEH